MAGRPRKSTSFADVKEIETVKEEPKKEEKKAVADVRTAVVKAEVNPWLNVRSAPTYSATVVDTLKAGASVSIYEEKSGFGKISAVEDKWVNLDFVD